MRWGCLVLAAAVLSACGGGGDGSDDAGIAADTGVAVNPDAAAADGAPAADAPAGDAGLPAEDAGVVGPEDASEPRDAIPDGGFLDALVNPDAEPPDTGGCLPIARGDFCGRVATVLAGSLARCNPELSPAEATAMATAICSIPNTPFTDTDPSVSYDPVAAGNCACTMERLGCDAIDPFSANDYCRVVYTGTIAAGSQCRDSHRCLAGSYCDGTDTFGPGLTSVRTPGRRCVGSCTPYLPLGAVCGGKAGIARCQADQVCDNALEPPVCVPRARAGEACGAIACIGSDKPYGFAALECAQSSTASPANTCVRPGRLNARCDVTPCHPLYRCSPSTQRCVVRPGPGMPCTLDDTTTAMEPERRYAALASARDTCRNAQSLGVRLPGVLGYVCVEGATPRMGTCQQEPTAGMACGIGPGLTPQCAAGFSCAGVLPDTLASIRSTCMPARASGDVCDPQWVDYVLSPQCADDNTCTIPPEGDPTCTLRDDLCASPE